MVSSCVVARLPERYRSLVLVCTDYFIFPRVEGSRLVLNVNDFVCLGNRDAEGLLTRPDILVRECAVWVTELMIPPTHRLGDGMSELEHNIITRVNQLAVKYGLHAKVRKAEHAWKPCGLITLGNHFHVFNISDVPFMYSEKLVFEIEAENNLINKIHSTLTSRKHGLTPDNRCVWVQRINSGHKATLKIHVPTYPLPNHNDLLKIRKHNVCSADLDITPIRKKWEKT